MTNIVVVEDDDAVRGMVVVMLVDGGYSVASFGNLAEARRALRNPVDLLSVDVEFGDGCGLDRIPLAVTEDDVHAPTIVLSSLRAEGDFVRGFCAGAVDYLGKTFSREELLARCAIHLARRKTLESSTAAAPVKLPETKGLTFGRYRLERSLGKGGYGEVFLARDMRRGGLRVAVKILGALQGEQAEARARFLRESYAASSLRHPRLSAVHDVGTDQGRLYYAMDYIDGPTLTRRVVEDGPLRELDALSVTHGLLEALVALQDVGLVHRDIKPDNVIFRSGSASDPVLVDFGLAKRPFDRGLTRQHMIIGTPGYLPPEVVAGEDADGRSDLFQVGLTLRFALLGEDPYAGVGSLMALRPRVDDGPDPDQKDLGVSPALTALLRRLMARKPDDRPSTAGEALELLTRVTAAAEAPTRRVARRDTNPGRIGLATTTSARWKDEDEA